jgi:hypothetical protein
MKTKNALAVLGTTIYFMLSGQSQNGTMSTSSLQTTSSTKNETINLSEPKSNKQILPELVAKPNEKQSTTIKSGNETSDKQAYKNAPVVTASLSTSQKENEKALFDLQSKADELTLMAQKLRTESKDKHASVKSLLIDEALNLEKQSLILQIMASELSAQITYSQFDENRKTIKKYITTNGEESVPQYAKSLIFDSEKIIRLAKEMREEANAQPTLASKLGTMSNAEEQEHLALSKQVDALKMLERESYALINN